jgi:transposase-like protein
METHVDEDLIRQLAKKIAKDVKTEADLGDFSKLLKKIVVETALDAELTDHLGYDKHSAEGTGSGNSRNGKSKKRLKGDHGDIDLDIPRDRSGSFEPQIIKKGQSRLTQMDDQILSLYAKGMSTRDITATFKELYDADVSPTVISKVTDSVMGRVNEWQARELEPLYPIIYLDCIVVKIRDNQQVIKKSLYLALGVDLQGHKDLLGI